jgi:hypothetical protein
MEGIAQGVEGRVAAQQWIDLIVVVGVIAVVAGALEDGGEVDGVDAQPLNVIEVVNHPVEITTFVTLRCRRRVPGFEVGGFDQAGAFGEAVGENLVEDGILDPIRRFDGEHGLAVLFFR